MDALKILELYDRQRSIDEKAWKVMKKCYQYANNWVDGELGQWSTSDRGKLKAEGRPIVSFNEIRRFANRLCGAQRAMKVDEKVWPRDDESDPMVADIFSDLLQFNAYVNNLETKRGKIFRDMVICGRGYERAEWNDVLDPLGEIMVDRINPMRVRLVGRFENYDMTDLDAIIEEMLMSEEELLAHWPKKKSQIKDLKMGAHEDSITVPETAGDVDYRFADGVPTEIVWDKKEKKFLVLRTQAFEWKNAFFVENVQSGERQPMDVKKKDAETAAELVTMQTGIPHRVVTKRIRYVKLTYSVGPVMLEEIDTGENQFDITGYFAYTDDGMICGVVQDLLDPQDEKNKRHSQIIHILGTAAKNSHFVKKGAIDNVELAEQKMARTGQMIEVNGNPAEVMRPVQNDLSVVPAIIGMDAQATAEMKEISGLGDASLGQVPSGVRSGRGIQALQQPVEAMVGELFDNFFISRKIAAGKILRLMQKYYTSQRRFRILGDYSKNFIDPKLQQQIEAGLVDVQEGMKVVTVNKMMGEKKLNDLTVGKYDVVMDQVSQNPTTRRAQYFDLVNMRGMGAPIGWKRIIEASDVRNKQAILSEMEQEEAAMMAQQMLTQQPNRQANPKKQVETDLQGNVAGGQF